MNKTERMAIYFQHKTYLSIHYKVDPSFARIWTANRNNQFKALTMLCRRRSVNVYGKKELELKRKNMCFVESIYAESVADHVYSGQWSELQTQQAG